MLVSEMTFLRNHWHAVAVAADVTPESGPRTVRLFGDDYVLWATGPGHYALSEPYCPHRSAHLSSGWVDDGALVCPYHGWRFGSDGACTLIPQMDAGLPTPPRARLRTFPAQARYGVIWACIGDDPVSAGPPSWTEAETEPTWRFFVEFFEQWQAAAPRITDNNLDHSHVAFVHAGTFGDPRDARLAEIEMTYRPDGRFSNHLVTEVRGVAKQGGRTDDESVRTRRISEAELVTPLVTRRRQRFGGAQPDYAFFGGATPVDDRTSIYFRLTGLAGTEAEQPWETFTAFAARVKEEDRVVLESTSPDFPVDITSEVHLRCDRPTLEYRKYLMAQVAPTPVALRRSA